MDRRQFARGLSLATAAVALPAVAVAMPAPEHPNDKVRRLAREIAETLRDPAFLGFRRVTVTPDGVAYDDAEQDKPAAERVASHFAAMADAMNELTIDAHGWRISAGEYNSGGAIRGGDVRFLSAHVTRLVREQHPNMPRTLTVDRSEHVDGLAAPSASRRPVPAIRTVPMQREA